METTQTRPAEPVHETGPDSVRVERLLPGPIDRVWQYLVDGEKRRTWLAGGDIEETEGSHFKFYFKHSELSAEPPRPEHQNYEGAHPCTVLEVDRPHRLVISWSEPEDGDASDTSQVTFQLEAVDSRVRLTLTHERLSGPEGKKDVSIGWHAHLDVLLARLNDEEPPFFWRHMAAIKPIYDDKYPGVKDFFERQAETAG
ncbi:SRPBCC family protein [Maricaulis sp. CAU 1757]